MSDVGNRVPTKLRIVLVLTFMASGRAMTLAFISRAGEGGAGDPPAAWSMPLIGDAVIGVSALLIAALLITRPSVGTWVTAIAWSAIGAFDALAALLVDVQTPWPDFFMLELFGRPMFVAAALMHVAIIWLLWSPEVREPMGVRGA